MNNGNEEKLRAVRGIGYRRLVTVWICILLILFAASFCEPFCDFYADHLYPRLSDGLSLILGWIPFPVGEILMAAAALLVLAVPVVLIILAIGRKKERIRRGCQRFFKAMLLIVLAALLLYELCWFLVLRSSLLGHGSRRQGQYTVEDLRALREYMAEQINETALIVDRSEDGKLLFLDRKEAETGAVRALSGISSEFGRLKGYYPPAKAALCSEILDAMDIGGYTYPYTMEVAYNRYITDLYYPSLIAHEYSHHKGYYRENEGVFLGCLSLMRSEDPFLRYSGFITAYGFVDKAYRYALVTNYSADQANATYAEQVHLSSLVWADLDQAKQAAKEKLEKEQSVPKAVRESAKEVSKTGWDTQDKLLDEDSYDGAVLLFLDYYADKLN